jgi:DNA (cytosine-5)-methyltransferase 1
LAAEAAGFETVGQCENNPYSFSVLKKHWPRIPRWWDIQTLTKESFYERTGRSTVDIISGGFPCQPFSVAGKQKGKSDERHLWPQMLRIIRELAPTWVVAENVPGIMRIAGDDVCASLHAAGYEVGVYSYEAAAVGAPHRRERVFFVGNAVRGGLSRDLCWWTGKIPTDGCQDVPHAGRNVGNKRRPESTRQQGTSRTSNGGHDVADADSQREPQPQGGERNIGGRAGYSGETMADPYGERREQCVNLPVADKERQPRGSVTPAIPDATGEQWERDVARGQQTGRNEFADGGTVISDISDTDDPAPARFGEHGGEVYARAETKGFDVRGSADWWAVEPDVGRVAYGIPNRVDRLKCLGNAVVPQQIYPIFVAIAAIERGSKCLR